MTTHALPQLALLPHLALSMRIGCALLCVPATASLATAQAAPSAGSTEPLRLLGLSVAASGGPRDTLGLLVATVVRNGPADQAGITTGSRVLAVNGHAVRLSPNDIGRPRAADSVLARFDEALRATSTSADVTLRVVGGGRTRTVSLATAERLGAMSEAPAAPATSPPASVPPTVAIPASVASPAMPLTTDDVVIAAPAVPATEATSSAPATLGVLIDALLSVQLDLRRIARDSQPRAVSDSLTDLEHDVALLRARLRRVQGARGAAGITDNGERNAEVTNPSGVGVPVAPVTVPQAPIPQSPAASVPIAVPAVSVVALPAASAANATTAAGVAKPSLSGLELVRVTGDLAVFLGPQADAALLVQSASDAWEPLRAGDVVLKVDGGAPDLTRLTAALSSPQTATLVVLRRGRTFSVAFDANRQP